MEQNIYTSIAQRTDGDIYVGVVGPVRTGKSTFIKKFMDLMVLPRIENDYARERARDEMPQSANGRTIMTTEPKFVPSSAVEIVVDDNVSLNVRFVDCVGYLVRGSIGHTENETPRMVSTPWFDHQIPFAKAAEIGTKKVINEHSTIGILVTTDGSFTEIEREDYVDAEERVVKELKEINKPFVMVLNSSRPKEPETYELRDELMSKYGVPVIIINCAFLKPEDINEIFDRLLLEFPISEVILSFPGWISGIDKNHELKSKINDMVKSTLRKVRKICEISDIVKCLEENDFIKKVYTEKIVLGEGRVIIDIALNENIFYQTISGLSGLEITGQKMLFQIIKEFSGVKKEYDKIRSALNDVREKGYGIVMPTAEELRLEEPEIVKQGGRFGVKLRASAPSIQVVRNKRI